MATDYLDPTGTLASTDMTASAGDHHTAVDDAVRQPTQPNLTDYTEAAATGGTLDLSLGSRSVAQVTQVKIWVHFTMTAFDAQLFADLSILDDTEFYIGEAELATVLDGLTEDGWASATYEGLTATQADLDDMRVRLRFSGDTTVARIHAVYAEITYAGGAAPASPSAARVRGAGLGFGLYD